MGQLVMLHEEPGLLLSSQAPEKSMLRIGLICLVHCRGTGRAKLGMIEFLWMDVDNPSRGVL
jgi:hypothetical protein